MDFRLGIKCWPEDDTEPIHHRPVWQILCKIAYNNGIRVYIKPLNNDLHLSRWKFPALIINEKVPNWYKPILLAEKIAQWLILIELSKTDDISESEILYCLHRWQQSKAIGKDLHQLVHKMVYPLPEMPEGYKSINTQEGWNTLANKASCKNEEKERKLQRLRYILNHPEEATPEELEIIRPPVAKYNIIFKDTTGKVYTPEEMEAIRPVNKPSPDDIARKESAASEAD